MPPGLDSRREAGVRGGYEMANFSPYFSRPIALNYLASGGKDKVERVGCLGTMGVQEWVVIGGGMDRLGLW